MGISVELVRKRYQRARQKLLEMGGEALYGCRNA
jgi:DNA-directed RNA polymerase specialized sigma24 family protein